MESTKIGAVQWIGWKKANVGLGVKGSPLIFHRDLPHLFNPNASTLPYFPIPENTKPDLTLTSQVDKQQGVLNNEGTHTVL